MRSKVHDRLASPARRSLKKLGDDLATARRRQRRSLADMQERTGMSASLLHRVERGDPTVSIAAYAAILDVLGFGSPLANIADQTLDERGNFIDRANLPQRIHKRCRSRP